MEKRSNQAFDGARKLADLVQGMINDAHDLDLQRLLKQIEADLMDIQHKLALVKRLVKKD